MTARAVRWLIVVVAVLGLTACDPVVDRDADVALGYSDGDVRFVSCVRIEDPGEVIAEWRDFAAGDPTWSKFLEASLESPIDAGVPFGPGRLPEGSEVLVEKPTSLTPGQTIALLVQMPAKASSLHVEFVVPKDGLAAGMWLRTDGVLHVTPCPT